MAFGQAVLELSCQPASVLYRRLGRFIKSIKYLSKIAENKQQVTFYE